MLKPMAVAIAGLIDNNKILLIKRTRGDYIGMWSLPGGKIEANEHISEACEREILEETDIKSKFLEHCGVVSEHLIENGEIIAHFLLHVCKLKPKTTKINDSNLKWFDLDSLNDKNIIPSDVKMIENLLVENNGTYFECIVEKTGDKHILKKFEKQ